MTDVFAYLLTHLLDGARAVAFTVGDERVTWAGLVGNACALLTVWLAIHRTLWTWPVQLTGNVLLFAVFVNADLGGNAMRQVLFGVLSVYGWWSWTRGRRSQGDLSVRPATWRERYALGAVLLLGTLGMAWLLASLHASWSPLADAYIFVGSAIATLAQGRALVDFWWIWVAVDAVGVPLAIASGLWVTGLVYGVFFLLCMKGFRDWLARYRAERERGGEVTVVA